jgi:hypothetical protein
VSYDVLPKWIGSKACTLGGYLPELLQLGSSCKGAQATNMGLVVLGLLIIGLSVRLITIHRQMRRERWGF